MLCRFLAAPLGLVGPSIIVRAVGRDHAEGLQHHVLPTDNPLRALNILREAAGLQPLAAQVLLQAKRVSPKPTAIEKRRRRVATRLARP